MEYEHWLPLVSQLHEPLRGESACPLKPGTAFSLVMRVADSIFPQNKASLRRTRVWYSHLHPPSQLDLRTTAAPSTSASPLGAHVPVGEPPSLPGPLAPSAPCSVPSAAPLSGTDVKSQGLVPEEAPASGNVGLARSSVQARKTLSPAAGRTSLSYHVCVHWSSASNVRHDLSFASQLG